MASSGNFSSASSDFKALGAFFCNFQLSQNSFFFYKLFEVFEGILWMFPVILICCMAFQNWNLRS